MEVFDAIVLGAGHQGLIAATTLADNGLSTAVVEAGSQIGGAVRSAQATEPGIVHDLFATNMNLFLGSPFYARYGDELQEGGLRFARSAHPYASVFPDGTSLPVPADERAALEMWRDHSTEDAAGWERLRPVFDGVAAAYLPLINNPQASWSALMTSLHTMEEGRRSNVPPDELAAVFLGTTRALGDRYFSTREAKAAAAAWGMHLTYGPDVSGGAVFPLLEMYADVRGGLSVVEGGAGRLPEAIARLLERRGGTVMTSAPVARIEVDSGGATGVTLVDGRRLLAHRGIISTVVLPHLVRDLLAHTTVPASLRSAADAHRFGPGTFMVHLALTEPIPWGDERLSRFAYVHAGGYIDDMARTYQQSLAGHLPDAPLLVVGQTSVVDPVRVLGTGRHIARVMVRTVPGKITADSAGRIGSTHWADARERFADRVMDILEHYAPGLKGLVSARTAVGPDELQRTDSNLVGGDTGAGGDPLRHLLIPAHAASQYHTCIPRLYLAGAGTWPGPGVNGISGQLAAETLLLEPSA